MINKKMGIKLVVTALNTFSNLLRILGLGSGKTWPGHIVLKIYPQFINNCLKLFNGNVILVSGTNGKTTTTLATATVLTKMGFSVCSNSSGANLLNGIASSLISFMAKNKKLDKPYCVLEVDESVLPYILKENSITSLILLNLSRDQLDRYGETDITFEKWVEALNKVDYKINVFYYKKDDHLKALPRQILNPKVSLYGLTGDEVEFEKENFKGFYNINFSLVQEFLKTIDISHEVFKQVLQNMPFAFGRGEIITFNKFKAQIFLAKNPSSFNENIKYLLKYVSGSFNLLFVLNDNIPDGRDISWIYDIDPNLLKNICQKANKILVSGRRSLDFYLRLKLAGVNVLKIEEVSNLKKSIEYCKAEKKNFYVLPTYSAMLECRKILVGRKIL